jgi:hypothetical protein
MRARWGRYCGYLQVVSWTLLCFEGLGAVYREVGREGQKGGEEGLAFRSFALFWFSFAM